VVLAFLAAEFVDAELTAVVLLFEAVKFRVGLWFILLIAQTPTAPTATIIINNNNPALCFILNTFHFAYTSFYTFIFF
jgi:hypothetical protein